MRLSQLSHHQSGTLVDSAVARFCRHDNQIDRSQVICLKGYYLPLSFDLPLRHFGHNPTWESQGLSIADNLTSTSATSWSGIQRMLRPWFWLEDSPTLLPHIFLFYFKAAYWNVEYFLMDRLMISASYSFGAFHLVYHQLPRVHARKLGSQNTAPHSVACSWFSSERTLWNGAGLWKLIVLPQETFALAPVSYAKPW